MKRFVQILNDKAHWIFMSEDKPEFSPDIIILDITDSKYDEVKEGWDYDKTTGVFTAPPVIPPPIPQPTEIDILKDKLKELNLQTQLMDIKLSIVAESVVI